MSENLQKYLAEAFGTFIFIFIATGSALANFQTGGTLGTVGIALASGLALALMISSVGHISGAHLNPAVTIALWATGHIKALAAGGYILAQLVGSVVAAFFLKTIFTGLSPQYFLGDVSLAAGATPGMGILVEALLTFFLVWVIFATLVDKKAVPGVGGFAAGLMLRISIMVGSWYTGAALNPARSFGVALLTSHWGTHYVYWLGPVIGALVAGFVYHFAFLAPKKG